MFVPVKSAVSASIWARLKLGEFCIATANSASALITTRCVGWADDSIGKDPQAKAIRNGDCISSAFILSFFVIVTYQLLYLPLQQTATCYLLRG